MQALKGVDLEVARGSITGLIGPNGSGKTTLFQVVSGMDPDASGEIRFDGESILGRKPYQIYHRGLARTFQLSRVFPDLTVLENLVVAAHRKDRGARSRALELLARVTLQDYTEVKGSDLSYGQQKLIEFLRVLVSEPSMILLDEPAAGVNPTLRQTLWDMVRNLNGLGTTFVIIEHNMESHRRPVSRRTVAGRGRDHSRAANSPRCARMSATGGLLREEGCEQEQGPP